MTLFVFWESTKEAKIEELIVNEDFPVNEPNFMELKRFSQNGEADETEHYPIGSPSLNEVIALRMFKMKFIQKTRSKY